MPCRCDDYENPNRATANEIATLTAELKRLRRDREMLKASLCGALRYLEDKNFLEEFFTTFNSTEQGVKNQELVTWWKKHKHADAARVKREAAANALKIEKAAALEKLSDREKKLLGL